MGEASIIATCRALDQVKTFIEQGVVSPRLCIRINSSHMDVESVIQFVAGYDDLFSAGAHPPLYIDLQGGKFRLTSEQPVMSVQEGTQLFIGLAPKQGTPTALIDGFTLRALQSMQPEQIGIHDGKVIVDVLETTDTGFLGTVRAATGKLMPRKGINVPGRNIKLTELSSKDATIVQRASAKPYVRFALSFVSTVEEVASLRAHSLQDTVFVAGKVEHAMTPADLTALESVVDEWWVCRGDLGVQLGHLGMAKFVHDFTATVPRRKRTIIAGEVVQTAVGQKFPSRGEMCHLYECMAAGYAGMVLSDETAFGKFPSEIVTWCGKFLGDFEKEI
ncbi:Pyruvate kinase, barrel domain [Carpediemonas membranifera]|uniref:pyruvate kinase n=1 Tax=Carpediemonas membranifera TaxID=201153 RepID=A0A8J6E5V7_9EUKA|nr:Pyruvate kinase, barrel domain [Carpediemonas membranifera]|eukprot:KAG9396367.1 Pyruvate kinase, barrel domain [Carpediemonas membranifera]